MAIKPFTPDEQGRTECGPKGLPAVTPPHKASDKLTAGPQGSAYDPDNGVDDAVKSFRDAAGLPFEFPPMKDVK